MQAAKTYLERKFEEFPSCDVDALMQHGLKVSYLGRTVPLAEDVSYGALYAGRSPPAYEVICRRCKVRASLAWRTEVEFRAYRCPRLCDLQALSASVTEDELSADNTAVALVGEGMPFTILEGKDLEPYLATLKAEEDTAPGDTLGPHLAKNLPIAMYLQLVSSSSGGLDLAGARPPMHRKRNLRPEEVQNCWFIIYGAHSELFCQAAKSSDLAQPACTYWQE